MMLEAPDSPDFSKALDQLAFFYIPFALLYLALRQIEWSPKLLKLVAGVTVALALIFSGIGLWEYATRTLFWNSSVIDSNQFAEYFRVNSVFYDPNIFGRFLDLAILAVSAVLLWGVALRRQPIFVAALVVLISGLMVTLSQSSFAALLVGLAVIAALFWRTRYVLFATGLLAAVAVVIVLISPSSFGLDSGSDHALDRASSGRFKLVDGGLELFSERPIVGYGSGSFSLEFQRHEDANPKMAATASHTIPLTVLAEQGVIGFAAYALLLVAILWTAFSCVRGPPNDRWYLAARAALAAAICSLIFQRPSMQPFLRIR